MYKVHISTMPLKWQSKLYKSECSHLVGGVYLIVIIQKNCYVIELAHYGPLDQKKSSTYLLKKDIKSCFIYFHILPSFFLCF